MRNVIRIMAGPVCGLALIGQTQAAVNDSPSSQPVDGGSDPYGAIWLRNVFDLKSPVAVTNVPEPVKNEPPPNVKLTGITTIFGKKQALFLVQPQARQGKPPEKEISYMLSEGDRRESLEVMEINPKTRKVTIKVDDVTSTITFATNSSPSMAGAPGGPRPGQFAPPPNGPPGFTPPSLRGLPGQMRPPGAPGFGAQAPQANYSPASYNNNNYAAQNNTLQGGYSTPAGINTTGGGTSINGVSFTGATPQLNVPYTPPVLNAEEQQASIAIQHQMLMSAGTAEAAGMASILPPVPGVTDGTSQQQSSSGGTSAVTPVSQVPFGSRVNGRSQ